ncbi:MAG: Holliday junction branch migration protein RuvA, partial [Thermodesulfobacteriota bacterium]
KLPYLDEPPPSPASALSDDALSALVNLGYRKTDAETALARLGTLETLEAAITGALKLLSRAIS